LQRRVSRRQWIHSVAAAAACASFAWRAASAAAPKRVMMLHSFGREFRPWSEYAKGIRAELEGQSLWPLDIIEFSLTAARFSDDDTEQPFVDYLQALFAKHPLDLIVSIGAPAAAFVQRHRQQLFPTTPMVLTAVERRRLVYSNLTENDTVVAVAHDLPAVIDNILRVLPDTRNVDVVNGNSPLEEFWREEMRREFKPFEGRVAFTWYNNLSFDDILKRTATLPPHSAIFWELLIVDAAGAVHEGDKALTSVHAVANAPIFSFDDSFFGKELVGGPMHSVLEGCRQTAAVAVRILGGEKAGDIKTPPLGFAPPKFDWREMRRWGISENVLPPNSEIYFREPTAWQRYRPQILTVSAAVLAQTALIAWLIYEHRRRNLAEVRSRNAIAELTYMNRRAAAGELSASIAHEVNQPLTAISAMAGAGLALLRRDMPDLKAIRECFDEIVQESQRAGGIIHSVRSMFRKDTQLGSVDINRITILVLELARIEIYKHKVSVQTQFADLPPLTGDPVQLQQVILNLVMNAIEAMHSTASRVLRITSESMAGVVKLSIMDTGTGVDPSNVDRIFNPMFTTKSAGMGMGLSICGTIVENHHGRIWVEARPGGGTIFHIELPVVSTSKQAERAQRMPA
jgi:signal transduction histidine kinase/ABC-type uncharacterized transport system substrate-binding protein